MSNFPQWLVWLIVVMAFCLVSRDFACAQGVINTSTTHSPGPPKPILTGNLFSDQAFCEFAIYLLPGSKGKPEEVLAKILSSQTLSWSLTQKFPKAAPRPTLVASLISDAVTSYRAPTLDALQYFGRGVSKAQADELQTCQRVYILDFYYPSKNVWQALRSANDVAGTFARNVQGLIWDQETREMFTPEEWTTRRVASWTGDGVPDITRQITIQAYKDSDYVRAITLGMSKMGLPDVLISNFVWSEDRQVGDLIDLTAQALAEGSELSTPGQFNLDINKIKNTALRDRINLNVLSHSTHMATLGLMIGVPEQGDPENRLIEITFDRAPGADNHIRQDALLSSLFGWEDKAKPIRHNEELLIASRRAKDQLPSLRDAFLKGFTPGEFIDVKCPFPTPDGKTEWMWVEVQSWKGDAIHGMLKNEPFSIPSLHGGQMVDVSQTAVFDYLHTFPDGHTEGNTTGPIIEKMEQDGP